MTARRWRSLCAVALLALLPESLARAQDRFEGEIAIRRLAVGGLPMTATGARDPDPQPTTRLAALERALQSMAARARAGSTAAPAPDSTELDWSLRAQAFEALARRLWLFGAQACCGGVAHGPHTAIEAPAPTTPGALQPNPLLGSTQDLALLLALGRRDSHASVRAAAWSATWASGLELDEATLRSALAEPLFEARRAAAECAGPQQAPSFAAAQQLAADRSAEVRAAGLAALLRWAGQAEGAAAARAWLQLVAAGNALETPPSEGLLAGFELLEGALAEAWARAAAAALEAQARALGLPGELWLLPCLLSHAAPLQPPLALELAARWGPARRWSARLGACLTRQAERLGADFGRALLQVAAAGADSRALDDALAALGPKSTLAAALELSEPAAFSAFLERARFAPLAWSEGNTQRALERLGGGAEALLLLPALEAAAAPLPVDFLLRHCNAERLDLAVGAFGLLARREPSAAPKLAALAFQASPDRRAALENELPSDRPWPDFAPDWLRRGEAAPSLRPELAVRLAWAAPELAREPLERWYAELCAQALPAPGRDPAALSAAQQHALGALLAALSSCDPEGAPERAQKLFVSLGGRPTQLTQRAVPDLARSAEGRALLALWLARGPAELGRAGREAAEALLLAAQPAEFAVRGGALEFLCTALAEAPAGTAELLAQALAKAPEAQALKGLLSAAQQPFPALREAAAGALAQRPESDALQALEKLALDRDLGVLRRAVLALFGRPDGEPALERLAAAWPPFDGATSDPLSQALAELAFQHELQLVATGAAPAERLDAIWAAALSQAEREFCSPPEWPAPTQLRYERLLAAFAAWLEAQPEPAGSSAVGSRSDPASPRVFDRDAVPPADASPPAWPADLTGLPAEVLNLLARAALWGGHRALAEQCLALALAAELGDRGGPRGIAVSSASLFAELAESPAPARVRLLAQAGRH